MRATQRHMEIVGRENRQTQFEIRAVRDSVYVWQFLSFFFIGRLLHTGDLTELSPRLCVESMFASRKSDSAGCPRER